MRVPTELSRQTGASGFLERVRELVGGQLFDASTVSFAPKRGGAYALLIGLDAALIFPHKHNPYGFAPGWYVYAGSAYGPRGIRARVGRHFARGKTVRWHVDHLTEVAAALKVLVLERSSECEIVEALMRSGAFRPALEGFGSSDCRMCDAHLLVAH